MEEILPLDLVITILLNLPAKSLIRFLSVCKSWNSIIKSKCFITTHSDINRIKAADDEGVNQNIFFVHMDYCFIIRSDSTFSEYHLTKFKTPKSIEVMIVAHGSCNGLVCFKKVDNAAPLVLLNPHTRMSKTIDRSPFPTRGCQIYGLGFDEKTNDYQVVEVSCGEGNNRCRVYNLNTNSWRRIADFPGSEVEGVLCRPSVFVNGAAYWLIEKYNVRSQSHYYHMLAFDFSEEVFRRIMLPEGVDWSRKMGGPYAHRGLICVVDYSENQLGSRFDVWVMEQYVVKDYWTKQYTICISSGGPRNSYRPLGIMNNGELVLVATEKPSLVLYNVENRLFKCLLDDCHPWCLVVDPVDNLVLLGDQDANFTT